MLLKTAKSGGIDAVGMNSGEYGILQDCVLLVGHTAFTGSVVYTTDVSHGESIISKDVSAENLH